MLRNARCFLASASLCLTALVCAGCAAPAYDADTDKLIQTAESDVDTELVTLIAADDTIAGAKTMPPLYGPDDAAKAAASAAYKANMPFYNKIDVALMSVKLRIDAETSGIERKQIDTALQNLRDNLLAVDGSLQKTHQQAGILSKTYLVIYRQQVMQQFGALMTYELVLKTGEAGGGGSSSTGATSSTAAAPSGLGAK